MTRAKNNAAESSLIVTHYETLRRAALGEALPPEARAGLTLFLRRGMWGWAQVVATRSAVLQPADSRPAHWRMPEEDRTIIHIFAALAIKADH